ncbi:DUF986 family protein [Enterobacter ludwigii]|uniref:DUF986 family protein n=1 Tax=Enterobacter cloacae TaxID=550 RepID=UPI000667406E|nr:DUF986 family protein [Enterobacter cloacae]MBO4146325.1 DUF986 family protein [Enterobacter ludwigii]UOY72416.1 DUF986 family protein [Enterobacter ludwigii]
MKNYLMENSKEIAGYMFGIGMILLILTLLLAIYNERQYKKIVTLYTAKFGTLPVTAAMSKHASLIATPGAYFAKIGFIFESLIFPYNRISNHDMSRDAYDFIRGLPFKYTIGFKLFIALFILGFLFMIPSFVIFN